MLKAWWRGFVDGLIDNDEKVASWKQIQFKGRVQKPHPIYGRNRYPVYDQNDLKTPFCGKHTYIGHIRE